MAEEDTETESVLSYEDEWWEMNCSIIPPEFNRLMLVGVVGAVIAFISVCFNTFLFVVLFRNPRHRHSHLIYLMFLSVADIFLSASYILLFPVNLYMDYFASEWLAAAWWSYMRIMITISHVFISTSAFLICAAAFERYITISKIACQFARHHRLIIIVACLCIAIVAKGPMYFEVEVVPNANCTGVTSLTAIPSEFSESEPYKTAYKFWFRNLLTVALPFIMCFYLNFAIMHRLRIQHLGAKLFRFATSEHRQNIRAATLMLVAVTCSYLASNLLNVVVYTWELVDKESLLSENIRPLYTLSSDLVSLLTVVASACRLPIYLVCNARIRCEVLDYVDNCVLTHLNIKPYTGLGSKRCRATTVRYCDTGSGYMIYDIQTKPDEVIPSPVAPNKKGERRVRSVGTGLDRVVLSVAMGSIKASQSSAHLTVPLNNSVMLIQEE
ncbi:hypothetical protein GCK72_003688 [Caenorhabditis remanei]|uniref:G-protein coupled receptors family 1 profile domain-containing protein n=1 Tax=Caenorhabditis remanei TaxID=31234 RepID=A0A6A5HBC3_CAERE|nr:hypothetical protein GCK72_003688 [Caenorhabditis remanei]KAF1763743.1 hypothetical protein GCK72_003688 [Caenorhabditis remanei]